MREFNLLDNYPMPDKPRFVNPNLRTIKNRIIATYRNKELYDGNRNNGYGGYKYDGRWIEVAKKICSEYKLNDKSSFLHIGCEKGFLMHDLQSLYPKMNIYGVETSEYAIANSMKNIKNKIINSDYINFNKFKNNSFDFVYATGVVYALSITDAIKCLKEIIRISKNNSFITLASYSNKKDYWLFKNWTLLGTTILLKKEWISILKHVGYKSDYYFTNADTLNLTDKESS
tara:strand:- start:7822 stop:8511 length:690 start_codon:yes stop_codon:yes gene_type:complete